jgi:hypothetical protein
VTTEYNRKDMEIMANIQKNGEHPLKCPKCSGKMVAIQLDPIPDSENAYITYDTIVECNSCSYKDRVISFSILGSVKNFDMQYVEIGSWSPSGSRMLSKYEHVLDHDLLKKLKESGELVEFLVINDKVVQVIG